MRSVIPRFRRGAAGTQGDRTCPLRVLGCNEMFPLISETYIEEELEALALGGAELAWYCDSPSISPTPMTRPVYMDLDVAIAEFKPDLLFVHWATFAAYALPRIEATGLPWALRVHSFDFDPPLIGKLLDHPNCVGAWAFPAHARQVPGTLALPPLFTSAPELVADGGPRDVVLSASAGLPKKDWGLLLDALGPLPDVDRRLIVAITNGHEAIPSELAQRLAAYERPSLLQVNVTHDTVIELMCRAAALIYTLVPEKQVAMPMSVVEGLCCGACVIVPDTPEGRKAAGPHARGYRTAEDITVHLREVLAGGPAIEAERRENMRYGREHFANSELFARFAGEVFTAVQRWRSARAESV
jgi:glycosyltransferase involved in cell wall biosynthesis